jgi:hypothetical protein
MDSPSEAELHQLHEAAGEAPGELLVQWQSAFGLIVIEVRGGHVYVNGELVELAAPAGHDAAA